LHWPDPPNPPDYPTSALGLIVALFAIALVLGVVIFYAEKSSGSHIHEPGPENEGRHEL
jgi:hypothetical protein